MPFHKYCLQGTRLGNSGILDGIKCVFRKPNFEVHDNRGNSRIIFSNLGFDVEIAIEIQLSIY